MEEKILWHEYSKEKPHKEEVYLIIGREIEKGNLKQVKTTRTFWKHSNAFLCDDLIVDFWAEFPDGPR